MGIETDLNVAPYYDDANNALSDNYHRILFRPAVPIQARELTQLQDILQNQIERFGDNIFVAGTIIKGCNFSFDSNYYYTKILDLRPVDSQPVNPAQYVGLLAHEPTTNLYAICVNYQNGFESQDPNLNTLYFKYVNSGVNNEQAFSSGQQLSFYTNTNPVYANSTNYFANGDVKIASVANAVGTGYAMSVSSGVIFQKGHFIQVANNTSTIVSKYTNAPDAVVVGFNIEENIVTELQDTNLLDHAAGYTNYTAPGAHRLQLVPTLNAYATNSVPTTNFFSLVEWDAGNITKSYQQTQFSDLGNELARRTYEESGNYFIKPFKLHMEPANATYNYAVTSAGLAYIEGHRVEQLNNIRTPVRKGTDTKRVYNQIISTNYNNSILVKEFEGNFPSNIGATISLRDTAGTKLSSDSFATSLTAPGTEIGTAKILAFTYESGTTGTPSATYRVYLADIRMNAGQNFRNVKAIYYGNSQPGVADVVLTYDAASNTNIAVLSEPSKASLIFKTAKSGLSGLNSTGVLPNYTYRTVANTTINASTGNSNLITLSGTYQYPYGQGRLSSVQEPDIIVIPTAFSSGANNANVTGTFTGTVVVSPSSNTVVANSSNATTFTSQYQVGDYMNVNGVVRRITNISNATSLSVDSNWGTSNTNGTHSKTYPVNVPINFADRNSYMTITDAGSQNLQLSLMNYANTTETLSANMTAVVYTNVVIPSDGDRNLQANTSVTVRLNLSNNAGGTSGPWCLGIPYGYRLRNVYKSSNTGTFTGNTSSGNTYLVVANTSGYSNGFAISGYGIPGGTTANVANSTAFVLSAAATATLNGGQYTYTYYSNSAIDDIGAAFYLKDGQNDALFDQSFLAKNISYKNIGLSSSDLLTVVFDAFKPQNTGKGYISVDSYNTLIGTSNGTIGFENIPSYTDSAGNYYELRDAIDFRPFVQNTAAYSTSLTASTVNPAYTSNLPASENYIVAPNKSFTYNADYYIGRIDKLMINSYGAYSVVEGAPAELPSAPADKNGSMTLATISIPPYPSLATTTLTSNTAKHYLVSLAQTNQNRVYTMKDISKLDQRLYNLEYYTSLNLLEQQTSALAITSSVTGANRFKNGIFVDNFSDTSNMDLNNQEFRASLSSSESALIPGTAPTKVSLRYTGGTNSALNGDLVTIADSANLVSVVSQPYASDPKNCTDNYYNYIGTVKLAKTYEDVPDVIASTTVQTFVQPSQTIGSLRITLQDQYQNTLFDGYTGTGNIPGGLFQIPRNGVQSVAAYLNSLFSTNLSTWKNFLAPSHASPFYMTQNGYFIAPETGSYTFTIAHDDYFSLSVGSGYWYVNDWDYNTPYTTTSINLVAGQSYNWKSTLYANENGQTASVISFVVNGNTYSSYPTAGQKAITAQMFARDNSPAVAGTPATQPIYNTQTVDLPTNLALANIPGLDITNLIQIPQVSSPTPVPAIQTPVITVSPIIDAPVITGGNRFQTGDRNTVQLD
jgi:hypothetical protein